MDSVFNFKSPSYSRLFIEVIELPRIHGGDRAESPFGYIIQNIQMRKKKSHVENVHKITSKDMALMPPQLTVATSAVKENSLLESSGPP